MHRPFLGLLVLTAACSAESEPSSPVGGFTTDHQAYRLELSPSDDPWPAGAEIGLTVSIRADGADVEEATLTVTPFMPAMGHGITEQPAVVELGSGSYEATWVFPMSGLWDVDLRIEGSAGSDTVTVQADVQ